MERQPPHPPAESGAPPAQPTALWEDFIDILYAPARVFARRRDGRFGPALVLSAVVGLALFFAFRGMFEAITDVAVAKQMQADPSLTPQQAASARETAAKFGVVTGVLQAVVGYPLLITLLAAALWLVGKIFGSTQRFAQAMTIAAYANLPRLLGTVVSGALFALGRPERVLSPYSVLLSPLRLVDEAALSAVQVALLSRFDLFTLWATVLVGVGLHVMGGLARSRAAMAAGLVWLVATMLTLASAARTG
jgi:hypothetical protein